MLNRCIYLLALAAISLAAGCGGGSSNNNSSVGSTNNSSSTPEPTSTISATISPSPSPNPTIVPTATITNTPLPSAEPTIAPTSTITPTPSPMTEMSYTTVFSESLDADVDGLDAYQLVREKFGRNSIEAPDVYASDHQSVRHLNQQTDDIVGDHFVFTLHLGDDGDKGNFIDRQRNEIKVYGSSIDELKGFEGKTFEYSWKFKVNENMEISKKFSHFFQLKAVYGDDAQPIITISGSERSGTDSMQIRYSPHTIPSNTQYLAFADWREVKGEWLNVFCRVTYAEAQEGGKIEMRIVRMRDNVKMLSINENNIDMWRGPATASEVGRVPFIRPKWGYYRSYADTTNLRADEEEVRFANFVIKEVVLNENN